MKPSKVLRFSTDVSVSSPFCIRVLQALHALALRALLHEDGSREHLVDAVSPLGYAVVEDCWYHPRVTLHQNSVGVVLELLDMLSGLPNGLASLGHNASLPLSRDGSVLGLACKIVQIGVLLRGGDRLWSFILRTRLS